MRLLSLFEDRLKWLEIVRLFPLWFLAKTRSLKPRRLAARRVFWSRRGPGSQALAAAARMSWCRRRQPKSQGSRGQCTPRQPAPRPAPRGTPAGMWLCSCFFPPRVPFWYLWWLLSSLWSHLLLKCSLVSTFICVSGHTVNILLRPEESCQEKHINSTEYLFMINLLERSWSENVKCRSNSGHMCIYIFIYSKDTHYIGVPLHIIDTYIHTYLCVYFSATKNNFR